MTVPTPQGLAARLDRHKERLDGHEHLVSPDGPIRGAIKSLGKEHGELCKRVKVLEELVERLCGEVQPGEQPVDRKAHWG